jgi:hypothetical protein
VVAGQGKRPRGVDSVVRAVVVAGVEVVGPRPFASGFGCAPEASEGAGVRTPGMPDRRPKFEPCRLTRQEGLQERDRTGRAVEQRTGSVLSTSSNEIAISSGHAAELRRVRKGRRGRPASGSPSGRGFPQGTAQRAILSPTGLSLAFPESGGMA